MFEIGEESERGTLAKAFGWGWTDASERSPSQVLRSARLFVVGKKSCRDSYKDLGGIEEGEIWARHRGDKIQSPCLGDSGGPLVINGKLAGIDAHGEICGNSSFPEVFTEVAHFRRWIQAQLENWGGFFMEMSLCFVWSFSKHL